MDPRAFDRLARTFSRSASRRRALSGFVGGALAAVAVSGEAKRRHQDHGKASQSDCAKWCAAVFGQDSSAAGQCTSDAAHGKGLCVACGSKTAPAAVCCVRTGKVCASYVGATCCDATQCLTCANARCASACGGGQTCQQGVCQCSTGQTRGNGQCVNTGSDPNNCGSCGATCPRDATCVAGTCTCPALKVVCGADCVDTQTDPNHCGACQNKCADGQLCQTGTCRTLGATYVCRCNDGTIPSGCGSNSCGAGAEVCAAVCADHSGTDPDEINGHACHPNTCFF